MLSEILHFWQDLSFNPHDNPERNVIIPILLVRKLRLREFGNVACRILAPQRCQRCILGTCEYVILHGQRGFADGIKVKELQVGRLSWII